jgi:HTH-type transcriptional regulator/antitoxin HipB
LASVLEFESSIFPYGNNQWLPSAISSIYSRTGIYIDFCYNFHHYIPVREYIWCIVKPQEIGKIVRETRKSLGVTQKSLALTSGTGLRFIIDLEKGKETCELGKALTILHALGIRVELTPPPMPVKEE